MLFHNTLLARRGCVNTAPHPHLCPAVPRQAAMPAALCWVTDSSSSPPLPPALEAACWHPTGLVSTESLWLCRWDSSSENDARPRVWESKEHLPLGRELAWRLSLLCPLPLNLSAPIWVTLTVQLGERDSPCQHRAGMAAAPSPQLSPATLWLLAPSFACLTPSSNSSQLHSDMSWWHFQKESQAGA